MSFEPIGYHHAKVGPSAPTQLNPHRPAYIAQAVLKALAKQRDNRYGDVSAFVKALQAPPDPTLKQYEEVLQTYEQAQRARDFDVCSSIEKKVQDWLLKLPGDAFRPALLTVL